MGIGLAVGWTPDRSAYTPTEDRRPRPMAASQPPQHRRESIPRLCLPSEPSTPWLPLRWPPWLVAWPGPPAAEKQTLHLILDSVWQLRCLSAVLCAATRCVVTGFHWFTFQLTLGPFTKELALTNYSAMTGGLIDHLAHSQVTH